MTDFQIGSPLLPTGLRKVEVHPDGSVRLHLDTEDHDKALVRSVADALRTNPDAIHALTGYAEVLSRLDAAERTDASPAERAALADEADDLLNELDRDMEWGSVGEGQVVRVSAHDTETLASALVYAVAEHIEHAEPGVVRELRRNHLAATGRTA